MEQTLAVGLMSTALDQPPASSRVAPEDGFIEIAIATDQFHE